MTVLAIVRPAGLVGKELREQLGGEPKLWSELRLMSTLDDEIGTLTEVGGAAAIVVRYDAEQMHGVDLAFFCGELAETRALLAELPATTLAVILSPGATAEDGWPVVAGVNSAVPNRGRSATAGRDGVYVSPHPGTVALAHLLHPLAGAGIGEAVATLIQPASAHEEEGLTEVFEQTRAIITFSSPPRPRVFGRQLAFNLLPVRQSPGPLVGTLALVLGTEAPIAAHLVQGAVFHSFTVSLYVVLARDPGLAGVRKALKKHPVLKLRDEKDLLGPIDAAGQDEVLVGQIQPDVRRPGGYWLLSVMDNLTRGGARNAVEIAKGLVG